MTSSDLPPVYALRAFGEARATRQLSEIGLASWAPTYTKLKPAIRGKTRTVEVPLIQGYVFARLAPENFAAALAVENVYGVVSANGSPAPIPEAEWVRVLLMVMSGRFNEAAPATKARPRGYRKRGLSALQGWFATYAQAA